ncbi:MAG: DHH family phosphoesterase [Nitrososphaerales archaeon]
MEEIGKKSLGEILALSESAKDTFFALIFTHRQADPDALCAAYAISEAIQRGVTDKNQGHHVTSKIIAPQGANLVGTSLSVKLGIEFVDSLPHDEISKAELIVAVDTAELGLLEPYSSDIATSVARKLLIDHHGSNKATESEWKNFETIVDANATSTCEIVTQRFPREYLDQKVAKALLAGLMFDSQHLGIATESTLMAALTLVRAGAKIDEAKELLRSKPERSEVVARIKSAQRLKYEEAGKFFVIASEVSSFQAAVARMLLDIGGDVGIAYGDHEGEARVSVRSTQQFFRETKIDLGEMLSSIAKELGLAGGGHSTAASISGRAKSSELASSVAKRVKALLPT